MKKDLDKKLERSKELLHLLEELKTEDPNLARNAKSMHTLLDGEKKDAGILVKKEGKEGEVRKGFFSLFGGKDEPSSGGSEGADVQK